MAFSSNFIRNYRCSFIPLMALWFKIWYIFNLSILINICNISHCFKIDNLCFMCNIWRQLLAVSQFFCWLHNYIKFPSNVFSKKMGFWNFQYSWKNNSLNYYWLLWIPYIHWFLLGIRKYLNNENINWWSSWLGCR